MIRVFIKPCGRTYKEEHKAAYELLDAATALLGLRGGKIARTPEGKPYFTDSPETFFSISHGGGYAVVAVGDSPCGVDAETDRPLSEKMRARFLSGVSEENGILAWTMRESKGKLLGGGFFDTDETASVSFKVYRYKGLTVTLCTYSGTEVSEKIEELG